jgi:hypothetical protein
MGYVPRSEIRINEVAVSFIVEPEKAYFDNIQQHVAKSIVRSMMGGDSDGMISTSPVPLDHQHKHVTMLTELKFKTGLRQLSRQSSNKIFDSEINKLWDLLSQGIIAQRDLNNAGRERRKTDNAPFRDFARRVANSDYLNANHKLALWSGGRIVSDYAGMLGYQCLEATAIGGLFDLIKIYRNDTSLWSLWDYLAKEFCNQVEATGGDVHAFVRTFDSKATLFESEYPALLAIIRTGGSAHIRIKFHVLVEMNANVHANENMSVLGPDGKSHIFRSLGAHGLYRETRGLQPFTYEDPFQGYVAQKAFLEANRNDPKLDQEALKRTLATSFVKIATR